MLIMDRADTLINRAVAQASVDVSADTAAPDGMVLASTMMWSWWAYCEQVCWKGSGRSQYKVGDRAVHRLSLAKPNHLDKDNR
jgi:hypothetical protein